MSHVCDIGRPVYECDGRLTPVRWCPTLLEGCGVCGGLVCPDHGCQNCGCWGRVPGTPGGTVDDETRAEIDNAGRKGMEAEALSNALVSAMTDASGYRADEYVTYAPAPACQSCGFADCPNAGNALDMCPRWDGTDSYGGES